MPPPNRYQNSTDLRLLPSQRLDTSLPSRHTSMSNSEPFSYNASFRRLSSRRARPTAASLADLFVSSLVMAGYCHEHTPRARGISTISMKNPGNNVAQWQDRGLTHRRQLSSKHRLDCLGTSTGSLHRSSAQRMINSGVALRIEDEDGEGNCYANSPSARSSFEDRYPGAGTESTLQSRGGLREMDLEKLNSELPTADTASTSEDNSTASDNAPDDDRIGRLPDSSSKSEKYRHHKRTSPSRKAYTSTSQLYRAAFGSSLNWKQAVDLVANETQKGPPSNEVFPTVDKSRDALEYKTVEVFLDAMWNERISNHYVFRLYRDLPSPGVAYLSKRSRGALLRRFADPPDRRWVDARRYLALIEDMVAAKLPISRSLWSSAIHLAGRASGKVRKQDVVRAIGLWKQMEYLARVKSDDVVFTILFDIAIKANQFTVAERLLEEMKKRNIEFRRFGKVSKLYYCGMQEDVAGIQETFNEFVSSGEIVDTVVMNCLMASFIRAGDVDSAKQIYAEMLEAQAKSQETGELSIESKHSKTPHLTSEMNLYRSRVKKLGRVLQESTSLKEIMPEHHRALQQSLHAIPDTRTFHIFLSLHAYKTADIHGFMSVLADMEKVFVVPPRGMIYLLLFDGFARNGRNKKGWTAERLRVAWKTYLRALYESRTRLIEMYRSQSGQHITEIPVLKAPAAMEIGWPTISRKPSGLYTPLPFADTAAKEWGEAQNEEQKVMGQFDERKGVSHVNESMAALEEDIDVDELFRQQAQDLQNELQNEPQDSEEIERRIENGVFLGRRMVIIILRAFGACCGPEELMKVWLQIIRIWQPEKRKALDVLAAKEELERQMNRLQRQY
ncbi:pentatricopeptide repeat protein [Aspergillus neoniger CBS 115656]|uniref:Pentatricopeptide repeat protein n=1 Tax=Aspergillus neoniger (strain CBS 115656) TaxID=1448310 RepID=A0A318YUD8_ASPNB|nr:pentatricopeptide repeat protein [Aspergillus neoniger CBS 115656]PYH36453.1 pentatricopeptide repeat protein [Aspergillus neoniger CBS 115656]